MGEKAGLIGRESEQDAIDALLTGARGGTSGGLLLCAEAGMGKTALLDYAVRQADDLRVLRTEGVEPEADLPFAGLHRLLRPVMHLLDSLPASQAGALRAALGLATADERTGGSVDRFLIGAGVLSLLAEAAEGSGMLCAIDDAQWLDPESADALGFAARRLGAEGVVMLVCARDGFSLPGLASRTIGSLSMDAVHQVLDSAEPRLAPTVRDQIVQLSAGNPLALLELPRALNDDQRMGAEPLPVDLDPGERIRTAWLSKSAALSEPTRRLLLVAAADPTADLGVLARVAEDLGISLDALEAAERAGLIAVSSEGVRFDSPLLRSAIYADATFLSRRTAHAALADAFSGIQPERWAWHRAAIAETADPVLADELERSAERAQHRAGYAGAASALERSAELTAGEALRRRRLIAAASAAWAAGQSARAEQLLTTAEAASQGPPDARISLLRGKMEIYLGRPASAAVTLRTAAEGLVDEHPDMVAEALTAAMEAAAIAGDFSQAPALAELASMLTQGHAFSLSGLLTGIAELVAGDLARSAVSLRSFIDHVSSSEDPVRLSWAAVAATFLGDDNIRDRFYDRAVDRARISGAVSVLPFLLEQRALGEWAAGRIGFAEADAGESARLAEELGRVRPALFAMATLTEVAAKRGQVDKARELGDRTVADAQQYGLRMAEDLVATALMELDLVQGRLEPALERALQLSGREGNGAHPIVSMLTTPTRVEVLVRAGQPVAEQEIERYRQWVRISPSPGYPPLLARCEAMIANPDDAGARYEEALRLHEVADRPFDHARTRLLYGESLRRQRHPRQARDHLRAAADSFDRLGCLLWAERARTELRAAGATAGQPQVDAFSQLSPQEMQIVRMVADGMSNRQVAGQLFLSPRTVEYHLYKLYPKLGISSRSELTRMSLAAH